MKQNKKKRKRSLVDSNAYLALSIALRSSRVSNDPFYLPTSPNTAKGFTESQLEALRMLYIQSFSKGKRKLRRGKFKKK